MQARMPQHLEAGGVEALLRCRVLDGRHGHRADIVVQGLLDLSLVPLVRRSGAAVRLALLIDKHAVPATCCCEADERLVVLVRPIERAPLPSAAAWIWLCISIFFADGLTTPVRKRVERR